MDQKVIPAPVFDRESWEETARTAQKVAAQSGYQLIGLRSDGSAVLATDATELPLAETLETSAEFTDASALVESARVARKQGRSLVKWDSLMREATFADELPVTARLRGKMAKRKKAKNDFELGVHIEWSAVEARAERVFVHGLSEDDDLESIGSRIPDWNNGWSIDYDAWMEVATFTWGLPRTLPDLVSLEACLPAPADVNCFGVRLGERADGRDAIWDTEDGVHAIITGPTGSGKSVLLRTMMTQALVGGSDIIIMDGSPKRGLDFRALRPYAVGWAEEPLAAAELMDAVYAEGQRRSNILNDFQGLTSWHELPPEVLERENIRQLIVFVDEFTALTTIREFKGLPKDHPKVKKAAPMNEAKASVMMATDDIAREMRFVGIRLVLGLQRPDANILGGAMRSNFPTMIQLKTPGRPLKPEALRMVFPNEDFDLANKEFRDLDTGKRGLAVTMQDGGDAVGFRVAFAKPEHIPPMLDARGISSRPQLPLPDLDTDDALPERSGDQFVGL